MRELCIFAGAGKGNHPDFEQQTTRLATMLAARGFSFIYGGGRTGLMGAFANGVLSGDAHITGIIPRFLYSIEIGNADVQNLEVVETMHERKQRMYRDGIGFIVLPGGLGTFEEWMEVMTWNQLGLINRPVFVLNIQGYWDHFLAMLETSEKSGFIHNKGIVKLNIATNADDLTDQIEQYFSP